MYLFVFILNGLEALSCIAAFVYWNKIKNSYWKYFPFYLLLILMCEILGEYFSLQNMSAANNDLYDYFGFPLEFLFFYWVFFKEFKGSRFSILPPMAAGIYIVSVVLEKTFFYKEPSSFSLAYTMGNLFLLLLVLSYFYQLIKSNVLLNFRYEMLFWVSLGLLVFYLGTFPYYGLQDYLMKNYYNVYCNYSYVVFGMNYVMYSSFILGFIWSKPKSLSS